MYQKLKIKSVSRQQYEISKRKNKIRERDKLLSSIKQFLQNSTKVPYSSNYSAETKITKRMGWLWIKARWHPSFRWDRYVKLCRY